MLLARRGKPGRRCLSTILTTPVLRPTPMAKRLWHLALAHPLHPTPRHTPTLPMQAPTKQQTGWGFIKPLSWDVWLALGLTVLAFPMVALVLEFLSVKGDIERGEVLPGYTESAVSHLWRRCRAQAVRFVMRFCGTAWLVRRSGSMRGRGSQAAPRCPAAGAPTSAPPAPADARLLVHAAVRALPPLQQRRPGGGLLLRLPRPHRDQHMCVGLFFRGV